MGWNLRLEASHVNNHIPFNNLITGYSLGDYMSTGWDSDKVNTDQDIKRTFETGSKLQNRFYLARPSSGGGYGSREFNLNLFSLSKTDKLYPEKLNIHMYENTGQNAFGVVTLYGLKLLNSANKRIDLDKVFIAINNRYPTAKESLTFDIYTFYWEGDYKLSM